MASPDDCEMRVRRGSPIRGNWEQCTSFGSPATATVSRASHRYRLISHLTWCFVPSQAFPRCLLASLERATLLRPARRMRCTAGCRRRRLSCVWDLARSARLSLGAERLSNRTICAWAVDVGTVHSLASTDHTEGNQGRCVSGTPARQRAFSDGHIKLSAAPPSDGCPPPLLRVRAKAASAGWATRWSPS